MSMSMLSPGARRLASFRRSLIGPSRASPPRDFERFERKCDTPRTAPGRTATPFAPAPTSAPPETGPVAPHHMVASSSCRPLPRLPHRRATEGVKSQLAPGACSKGEEAAVGGVGGVPGAKRKSLESPPLTIDRRSSTPAVVTTGGTSIAGGSHSKTPTPPPGSSIPSDDHDSSLRRPMPPETTGGAFGAGQASGARAPQPEAGAGAEGGTAAADEEGMRSTTPNSASPTPSLPPTPCHELEPSRGRTRPSTSSSPGWVSGTAPAAPRRGAAP